MHKDNTAYTSADIEELRARLEDAEATLDAIRRGEVDGLVVSTPKGEQVYTISGAEKPYRLLIEDMKEGAVMLASDNTILYCNNGFAKMVKNPMDKIVGHDIHSMISPNHQASFEELLTLGRMGKGVMAKEIALQAEDNTIVPTQISINSLIADDVTTTFLVVTDLTQHMEEDIKRYTSNLEAEISQRKKAEKALKESEERFHDVFEKTELGIAIGETVEYRVIESNIAFQRMLGYSKEELNGKKFTEFTYPDDTNLEWPLLRQLLDRKNSAL